MKPTERLEELYREEVELWRHRDPRGGTPLPSTEAALRQRATWRFLDQVLDVPASRLESADAAGIETRVEQLEAVAHAPFDFTELVKRVEALEAVEAPRALATAVESSDVAGSVTLVCEPGRCGGEPTIGESRLTVVCILGWIRGGFSDDQIAVEYPSMIGGSDTVRVLRRLWEALREAAVAQ